jgi:hypothetical protein
VQVLYVPRDVTVQQISDFPSTCDGRKTERSRNGSLYVRPNSTLTLSDDEVGWVKSKYPRLFAKLQIVADAEAVRTSIQHVSGRIVKDKPVPIPRLSPELVRTDLEELEESN